MKKQYFLLVIVLTLFDVKSNEAQTNAWLTKADKSMLLEATNLAQKDNKAAFLPKIFIDPHIKYQQMAGFGYTFTGGSAEMLAKLPPSVQDSILQILFGNAPQSIGISYLRLSIGASDLSKNVFTYSDFKDKNLHDFSLRDDTLYLLPLLKKIVKIRPDIQFMATPWTPPLAMKSNQKSIGGQLLPAFYADYALYLTKYVQTMQQNGINIQTLTVQNEPLHPLNNPSMLMLPDEQAAFVVVLGETFKKHKIKTKILIYDHNADRPDYALQVLKHKKAYPYIDGTAFHLYGGDMSALSAVHDFFPEKNLYFTEQWTGAKGSFEGDLMWHTRHIVIDGARNWCKTILEWNLANDARFEPHTEGGCTECKGALTIEAGNIEKNVSFYIIAHISKFNTEGGYRVASNQTANLPNVAFLRKDGKIVLLVMNDTDKKQDFEVEIKNQNTQSFFIPSKSVATFVF